MIIRILLIVSVLTGCKQTPDVITDSGKTITDKTTSFSEVCLNGVVYYAGNYRLTVKLDRRSKIEVCDG